MPGKKNFADLAAVPKSQRVVSTGYDGFVRVWDIKDAKEVASYEDEHTPKRLAVSPDGKFAVSGESDSRVRLWGLPPAAVASGTPVEPAEKKALAIEGWGNVLDPDGDCTIKADKDVLTISVPATYHDVNARVKKYNAPRVLREAEGDFTAQVKVTGEMIPGEKSTTQNSAAFMGAGLQGEPRGGRRVASP